MGIYRKKCQLLKFETFFAVTESTNTFKLRIFYEHFIDKRLLMHSWDEETLEISNDKDDKLSIYQIHDNILNFLIYNFWGCHLLATPPPPRCRRWWARRSPYRGRGCSPPYLPQSPSLTPAWGHPAEETVWNTPG